jgi:choice-of-anchor B domain-containing protein
MMKSKAHTRLLLALAVSGTLISSSLQAQTESNKIAFKSRLSLAQMGATFAEDSWGYVSPSQREYAIIGLSQGTGFIEITDPENPVIVSVQPQAVKGRDMKVYQNYVFSSVDSGPTYIYDVSDIDNGNVTQVNTIPSGTHNIFIDEVSAFLYLAIGGPLDIYSLADPVNPVFVGSWNGETHDTQVITYTTGPNAGKQIAFVFAGRSERLDIIDVTDKSNIVRIGTTSYPNSAYTHQGWLSEDQQLVYANDELDNIARTTIFDVSDLTNPFFVQDYTSGSQAADHNLYVKGDYIYEANYASGLRILDARDPLNLVEVGHFDTYPLNNGSGFVGAWNVYPFFPSGNVIVSDRSGGLFVLDPLEAISPASVATRNAGSNPSSYAADAPVMGLPWSASVDLASSGHSFAQIVGFTGSGSIPLGGGQTLLVGGTSIVSFPMTAGPVANFNDNIPANVALIGFTLFSQAIHFGGVIPFALSNAQDLTIGF